MQRCEGDATIVEPQQRLLRLHPLPGRDEVTHNVAARLGVDGIRRGTRRRATARRRVHRPRDGLSLNDPPHAADRDDDVVPADLLGWRRFRRGATTRELRAGDDQDGYGNDGNPGDNPQRHTTDHRLSPPLEFVKRGTPQRVQSKHEKAMKRVWR